MLYALMLGWALLYADRTSMYPLLSVIGPQLGISSTLAGSLTSAYFLMYVLMQIPSGLAGDRWGLKRVLIVMFGISGIGIAGIGLFGTSYLSLLLLSALHGLGAGAYYPACYGTMLSVVPPEKRGYSSGLIGIGMAFGILGGMAVSGPVFEWSGSFRAPFLILGIPTLLMLFVFRKYIPETKSGAQPSLSEYARLLKDPDIWKINLATFASLYGFWVAVTWGPTFLKAERGFSLSQAGLYTGLVALSAIPAGIGWGRLSDRIGRKKVAVIVLPASAFALYLITLVTSSPAIIAAFLLFGMFANSAFVPTMVSWIGDIVSTRYPRSMGAAIGFFNAFVMSSAIVAPLVSGLLRDVTSSLIPAIHTGCGIMALGTILLILTPGDRKDDRA